MATDGYTTKRTFAKIGTLLDNALYLLERLNDSRATVFLLLREVSQPIHVSEIIKRSKVSRRQVYRALQFLKSIDLADHIHGYWYEKIAR
jgi:DNA invertase Pin-like site-specific DNA recombinase